jgi:hypothetical protein
MTTNELLFWLSARKEGSWPQFRTVIEALDLAAGVEATEEDASLAFHQRVRFNLERLGHVEFSANQCKKGWRVVPPVLALCQDEVKAIGILCGARTPKLLDRVERAANELDIERTPLGNCPDVFRIRALEAEKLIEGAERAGIFWQIEAPTALLSHLPKIDSLGIWRKEPLPSAGREWEVRKFVVDRRVMKWDTITLRDANRVGAEGFFCFTRFQRPQYYLRRGQETFRLPGAIGKYYLLARRRVLSYDHKKRRLTLPAICRPPLLVERALILCSGFLPETSVVHNRLRLTYRDIPEEVAGLAAEVLRQDLL